MIKYLIVTLALLFPGMAMADLDYRCLSDCKNEGGATSGCIDSCEYTMQDYRKTVRPGEAHREFDLLTKVGATTLPPRQLASSPRISADATCVHECMRKGLQYTLCHRRCSSVEK